MGTTSIGIGINVNGLDKLEKASNLLTEFTNLNPMLEDSQTPSLVEKTSTKDILEKQEEIELLKFNQILQNLNTSIVSLIDKVTKLNSETKESLDTETKKNDQNQTQSVDISKYKSEKSEKSVNEYKDGQNGINNVQNIATIATQIANQNVVGGVASAVSSVGSGLRNKGKEIASSEDGNMKLAGVLTKLGVAGILGGIALKTADVATQKYENALPGIDGILQTYGYNGMYNGTAIRNANYGLNARNTLTQFNKGTGLSDEEFIAYANTLGQYGINDIKLGGKMTKDAAFWQRYTGADMSSTLGFMGTVQRLGGNGIEATEKVYEKALESGLTKNQFPEFLSGVQRAIEQGIAQGFIRSSEDVAENLSLLARLSGNDPSWIGERGANRYSQMTSAMANNTSLSTTSSMIMYRTAGSLLDGNEEKELGKNKYLKESSADWINTMAYIEKGDLSGSFLKKLKENVENSYSGDVASQVLTYKEQFGLNYQGAIEVYNMLQNLGKGATDEQLKTEIEKITGDKEFQSDSTRLQDSLNSINQAITNLGKGTFDVKMGGLEVISNNVENIYGEMIRGGMSGSAGVIAEGLSDKRNTENKIKNLGKIADFGSEEQVATFKEIEKWYYSLPEWKRKYFEKTDRFSGISGIDIESDWKYIQGKSIINPNGSFFENSDSPFDFGLALYSHKDLNNFVKKYADKYKITPDQAIDNILQVNKNSGYGFEKMFKSFYATNGIDSEEIQYLIEALHKLTETLSQPVEVN